jgi:hypothetical protein
LKRRNVAGIAAIPLIMILNTVLARPQSPPRAARSQPPGWFLQGTELDPVVVGPDGRILPASKGARVPVPAEDSRIAPPCIHSPVCNPRIGGDRTVLQRVEWRQSLGFTYAYPFALPEGVGGVSAVAINSKGYLWVFQRNTARKPQLFEFDPNHKLIRTIGDDVITYQYKPHGMAVDAQDLRRERVHREETQPRG